MKIFLGKKIKKLRAFTMMELVIAMLLTTMVMGIAVSVVNLLSKGYTGTNMETTVVRDDSEFLFKINEGIKGAATAFTMPQSTFHIKNLSKGWNYLGIMKVDIDSSISRTGKSEKERALVYAEYKGEKYPDPVPRGAIVEEAAGGNGGWFLIHVLGHDFTDANGYSHEYKMEFLPAGSDGKNSREIGYTFTSTVKDKDGNVVAANGESDMSVDISSMLTSLNSTQVVYRGSKSNPATALAFCSDVLPSSGSLSSKSRMVTFVLDYSTSMADNMKGMKIDKDNPGPARVKLLQDNMTATLQKLSEAGDITVAIIPFAATGRCVRQYSKGIKPINYSLPNEMNAAVDTVNELQVDGSTNLGDGLRVAYKNMRAFDEEKRKENKEVEHYLYIMTDGRMVGASVDENYDMHEDEGEPLYAVQCFTDYNFSDTYPRKKETYDGFKYRLEGICEVSKITSSNVSYYRQIFNWSTYRYEYCWSDQEVTGIKYFKYWGSKIVEKYNDIGKRTIPTIVSQVRFKDDEAAIKEIFGLEEEQVKLVTDEAEFQASFDSLLNFVGETWMYEGPAMIEPETNEAQP